MKAAIVKNSASIFCCCVYIPETKLIQMEMQITDLPVLQKSKETNLAVTKSESSCCSQPSNGTAVAHQAKLQKKTRELAVHNQKMVPLAAISR